MPFLNKAYGTIRRGTSVAGRFGARGRLGRLGMRVGGIGGPNRIMRSMRAGGVAGMRASSTYQRGRGYRRMAMGGAGVMAASRRRRQASPYGSSGGMSNY